MNIPRWLLPVVAVVAALAVGVAAVLDRDAVRARRARVGVRARPRPRPPRCSRPLPPEDGDDGEDADGDGDPADPPAGAATRRHDGGAPGGEPGRREREVAVPEEDAAESDTELLRLIDLIGLSPDLLVGLMDLGLGERDDDPCAPRDGAPADDCPPGVAGVVLYDLTPCRRSG